MPAPARAQAERTQVQAGGGEVEVATLLIDALELRSLYRKIAFQDGVLDDASGSAQRRVRAFEFADTMPTDDIRPVVGADASSVSSVDPQARLSPIDCKLVSTFVPVGPAGAN
jgi:hypothetical protein